MIKYVYVAGPYISHPHHNMARAIAMGNTLVELGFTPIIPHLVSNVWNVVTPREEEFWLKYTLDLMLLCDAVIRIPGHSKGADNEVAVAKVQGIPVYYSIVDLIKAYEECLDSVIKGVV